MLSENISNPFFETSELPRSQRICFADDRDDVDTRGETAHQLDVYFSQTVKIDEVIGTHDMKRRTRDQWE
jgi:hypothetical protein